MKNFTIAAALVVCAALAGCGQHNGHDLDGSEMNAANGAALLFANQANMQFVGCSGLDSEPDGYTTCTLQDRQSHMFQKIQCSYSASGGCKPN